MKKVLITGASGFVGSFLVEEAIKRGYKPIAGIRTSSSKKYLQQPEIDFIYFNLFDKEQIKQQLNQYIQKNGAIDYIIHNAGVTKVKRLDEFMKVNYECTRNFVEALLESKHIPEKYIQISSLAAFGPGNNKTLEPVKLSDTPQPNTEYGRSKLKAEEFIRSKNELPWIVFRPTGVYGPRETDYFVYLKTINRGFEPYIGFKSQHLTFIYVKDLARLVFDALESPFKHRAYFIADNNVYLSEEYAAIVKKHLHKKTIKLRVPLFLVKFISIILEFIFGLFGRTPVLNKDKYNILSSLNWKCEVEPLQRDFNFKAEYDLDKGVKESIDWYKEQKWL
ncbi:MAG: NAD(P)-dependent oxidoreductase [Bacteroidales bacterium]|nr:NAD(P)-dependent oxidoreductase [Bacteroidales bacterium]